MATTRPFDILVYGATGFTGKKVAAYLCEQHADRKVAIAGRSADKLQAVAEELGLTSDSVMVAPVDDMEALKKAVGSTRVVLACAGPYRHVGREIVAAAIATQTDYLDLCGEPQYFDDTLVEFEEQAREAKTLIVSACAFDCVPAELSMKFVAKEFRKRYPESPVTGVEIVHTFHGISHVNATTFHAAVDGFHAVSTGELSASRKKVKEAFPVPKAPPRPSEWPNKPQAPGTLPVYHEPTKSYIMKFMGADAAAILNSERYLRIRDPERNKEPQPRLSVCFGLEQSWSAYKFIAFGSVFSTLARFQWGCDVLHKQPELFTGGVFRDGGPSDDDLKEGGFVTHSVAYGLDDKALRATCSGPEPGYVATPKMLVALAVTVLDNRSKLAFDGGVMLPGALFGECQEAFEQLDKEGITFQVLVDGDSAGAANV